MRVEKQRRQHGSYAGTRTAAMAAAAVLALSACISMAPPYEAPALPVAQRYDTDDGTDGLSAAATGWQAYFTDTRLQALIAQALENNRDLRTAVLRVEEARAAFGIQRSESFPHLDAQAGVSRLSIPADVSPFGMPMRVTQYQVGAGVSSWEIDFWGRVRNLNDAALESYVASDAARRAVALGLIAQVADSYLVLRELDERIALAQQTVDSRTETLRIFSRRVAVGATSRLNQTQVETLLTQAQALLTQLRQARDVQAHGLAVLVGKPIDLPPVAEPLDERHMLAELRAGLPSDLLTQRPDIAAAEHRLRAAHASIGAARAAFFPRVALTGAYGTVGPELGNLFAPGTRAWVFAPSISLPLFEGGKLRSNLDLAEARRDLAVAAYEKTVQGAFRDVSDALSARRWLAEQLDIAKAALAAQTERARLSQLRFDAGASTFLEVLDAQRDLLAAQQQLVQMRRALLSSRVGLYAALGGGTQAVESATDPQPHPLSLTPAPRVSGRTTP
ncbi:Outer membrane protein OprM [Ralstonia edaphis]|uniref:efflux transporter outer membrane subunit n=1 Tax=Ralstonia edaphi TaxID=3058599 RepID=UPI0028F59ABB|nr:efflux transporter outer membrane subunit [Ralstonia sp. LMG 6871]CAJ0720292.1 Outer membrane protein OprM [Ralstonia sp. LMG 6871]